MQQQMLALVRGRDVELTLPDPDEDVLPGVAWGRFDVLFTPAFWRGQAWQHAELGNYAPVPLGGDLAEEVAVCLLGGYGIPAELGLAAFDRLRNLELLKGEPDADDLESALSAPFQVLGQMRRYRFARSKAQALAGALRLLPGIDADIADLDLRNSLMSLPGIGPKTASWIVRNFRGSDDVAIMDVHIARAGRIIGFIGHDLDPSKNYFAMETAFLGFASAIGVRASVLDGLMWDYMRRFGAIAREAEIHTSERTGYGSTATGRHGTPSAAVPQATTRGSSGNREADMSPPRAPRGQNPRPIAVAQRCKLPRSAPASRQSRLPGFL